METGKAVLHVKQSNYQPPNVVANNDAVIRHALKSGDTIFICVHKVTSVVVTSMGPRPVLYTGDTAADSPLNGGGHKFVTVDPRDPFADCFPEETEQGNDRWMYHPLMVLDTATGKVIVPEPNPPAWREPPPVVLTHDEDSVMTADEAAANGLPYIETASALMPTVALESADYKVLLSEYRYPSAAPMTADLTIADAVTATLKMQAESLNRELRATADMEMAAEISTFWDETAAAQEDGLGACLEHGPGMVGPDGLCGKCEEPFPGDSHTKPFIIVRHSELVDAASCLYAYNQKWIKNLRPKRTDAKLSVGSMFHAFQEVYEGALADEGVPTVEEALGMGLTALDTKGREFHDMIPDGDPYERFAFMDQWRFAKDICNNYHAWRTTDPYGQSLSSIVQAEGVFNIKLGEIDGVDVYLSGTMDGIGVTRVTFNDAAVGGPDVEEFWLREYKTCASIPDKLKQYRLDKQTRRYVAALRQQGIHVVGVELVLAAKSLPMADEEFLLKPGKEGTRLITKDQDKWSRANHAQALRIKELGKFAEPDGKTGLTEQGFHAILKVLEDKANPFFHAERLYFNDHELNVIMGETLVEAHRLYVTRVTSEQGIGDLAYTRNQGPMGWNCKSCSVRDLCEMNLKGVDTTDYIAEHFMADASIHAGKEIDDTDD